MKKITLFLLAILLTTPILLFAQAPVAYFSESVDSICGSSLTNSFRDASGNKPTSWKWYFSGATPDTSTLRYPTNIQYNGYGCYNVTLVVSNQYGSDSLTKNDYVCLDKPITASFTGPTTLCQGSRATITAYGGTQYHWSNGATASFINITGVVTETYTVQIRSGACFKDTSFTVHVDTMPTFVFRGPTSICLGDTAIIYASPKNNGYKYLWSTGSTTDSKVVIGTKPGIYIYYVSITGKGGCSRDSAEIIVKVQDCTGVENYTNTLLIDVFPDPVNSQLSLQSDLPLLKNNLLTIIDITGRKVFSEVIGSKNLYHFDIDVSSISPGIYFLQFPTNQGMVIKKFVKE